VLVLKEKKNIFTVKSPMDQLNQQPITIYGVFKDIIIPSLTLLSTIVIGTIIAISLKKREEKAKIKALLIDTYMEYLSKTMAFFNNEIDNFNVQVLKELTHNYENFFGLHANDQISKGLFKKRIDELRKKINQVKDDKTNWSFYTYRFAFLLGKKKYNEFAQPLETAIATAFAVDVARNSLSEQIIRGIKADKQLNKQINSMLEHEIEDGISTIELLTATTYNDWQRQLFEPYSNAVADLIDQF
jgi:hypothetical protein